jgi:hypothetical protein
MRTPARKTNPRSSQRAERLRREAEKQAQLDRERVAAYGPVDPEPVAVGPQPEPEIPLAPVPPTSVDDEPLEVQEGALATLAHEINQRLALYDRLKIQSEDHQLAAAIRLAEAKKLCEENKITFKAWAEMHITQGYSQARKMAVIGAATDPKAALEEFRSSAARRNKALRERRQQQIAGPFTASRDTPRPEPSWAAPPSSAPTGQEIAAGTERPLTNERLDTVYSTIKFLRVPEIQSVVVAGLEALEKAPAIEALERAGFTVLDQRQSVSG